MTTYEIVSLCIAILAFILSSISLYFSFRKHKREQPQISIDIDKIETGIQSVNIKLTISNNSEIDTSIKKIYLSIDSNSYQAQYLKSDGRINFPFDFKDVFLQGHQSITANLYFYNVLLMFKNAKLCIETTDNKNLYKYDLTSKLSRALRDNN